MENNQSVPAFIIKIRNSFFKHAATRINTVFIQNRVQ